MRIATTQIIGGQSQRAPPKRDVEQPQQRAERRDLGAGGHERGDRGRRALVDVGRPGVERRGADLEQQADRDQRRCRRAAARRCRAVPETASAMSAKLHRAGEAVEQRDAVEEERRRRTRRAGSTSAPPPGESSRRRRASPHSRYSGSESTSSATNIVSRSLAAGNSSMPPTANIISGKTSVCSRPRGRGLALGLGAGQRRGLAGERGHAALEAPLGEQQHADQREHQDRAPQEQRRAVDGERALGGDLRRARHRRRAASRSTADHDGRDQGADQAEPAASDRLDDVAQPPRHERLDEHADAARRRRRSAAARAGVLDARACTARLGELVDHGCDSSSASEATSGRHVRLRVADADLVERVRRPPG